MISTVTCISFLWTKQDGIWELFTEGPWQELFLWSGESERQIGVDSEGNCKDLENSLKGRQKHDWRGKQASRVFKKEEKVMCLYCEGNHPSFPWWRSKERERENGEWHPCIGWEGQVPRRQRQLTWEQVGDEIWTAVLGRRRVWKKQNRKKAKVENSYFEEWDSKYVVETYACI